MCWSWRACEEHFAEVISSDEVGVGKPAPDVYMEACRRLGTVPARAAGWRTPPMGLRRAQRPGWRSSPYLIRSFPASAEALALADLVVDSMAALTETVTRKASRRAS